MSKELPSPTAQGDLTRTPFAHALLYCHQRALDGTLVVWPEDPQAGVGQDRIRLKGGAPVAARLATRASALDRGLLPLFARKAGPYAFYADVDLVGEGELVRTGRVDPLMLIAASLRGPTREDVVESVLGGLQGTPVRLKPGSELRRFELLPKEQQFIDVVRAAPATIEELIAQCELGPQTAKRLLYLLAITKSLEPYTAPAPAAEPAPAAAPVEPASAASAVESSIDALPLPTFDSTPPKGRASSPGSASAPGPAAEAARTPTPRPLPRAKLDAELPPQPPAGLAPEHLAHWNEVAAKAAEIDKQNYFDMLGITKDAGTEAVRKAYFGMVKKWHPDRVPNEIAAVRPFVERIFHHITGAHDTLSDDKKRGNYTRTLGDGGGTPESDRQLAAIVQAAMDHQKAEVLIKRRDVEGAITLLREAMELNPEDDDIHATYAWALFSSASPPATSIMLASADRALLLNPKSDRAHYYRGMILRKAGREAESAAAFEKSIECNPKNVDAMREVRIARMRGGKAPPASTPSIPETTAPKTEGLLSKLFGSKKDKA